MLAVNKLKAAINQVKSHIILSGSSGYSYRYSLSQAAADAAINRTILQPVATATPHPINTNECFIDRSAVYIVRP